MLYESTRSLFGFGLALRSLASSLLRILSTEVEYIVLGYNWLCLVMSTPSLGDLGSGGSLGVSPQMVHRPFSHDIVFFSWYCVSSLFSL